MKIKHIEIKDVNQRLTYNRRATKGTTDHSEYFVDELEFTEMLNLERKRSQRSMKPLMLMRLDVSGLMEPNLSYTRCRLISALATGIRDTDVRGWYKRGSVIGILFTDIDSTSPAMREILFQRVMSLLVSQIDSGTLFKINMGYLTFPEGKAYEDAVGRFDMGCYKDLANQTVKFNISAKLKSLADVAKNCLITFSSL